MKAFLSSAGADHDIAARLRNALRDVGVEAQTDDDIRSGADWGEHLRAAMDASDAVIFLATPAALSSAYVMSEVGAAVAAGKTIVPLVLSDHGLPHGLPAPLRRWQFLRAGKRDANEVAAEIRERLVQFPASAA